VLPDQDYTADFARDAGMSVSQLLGNADIPMAEVAWKYEKGKPLVRPEKIPLLPTQMRKLHEWYLKVAKEGRQMLMVKVRIEHYFREDEIHIDIEEFFQLFNQDALDKSLVSCYCL
jgi:hypothetical protein